MVAFRTVVSLFALIFHLVLASRNPASGLQEDVHLFEKRSLRHSHGARMHHNLIRTPTNSSSLAHGPTQRGNWLPGFSIKTDTYTKWPTTGRTVRATYAITNTTMSPDGVKQNMMVVNGQYPGPLLEANWGDWIEVTVYNNLKSNGTTIHWHGFRHLLTNTEDGVPGITECPIAPGKFRTYRFQATQYGTSWYHSHFSKQYGAGVIGPIIINGPSSANYDIDLGTIMVNDWYGQTVFQAGWQADRDSSPTASNYLLNGQNTRPNGLGGKRATFKFQPGKKHLLRFVNAGVFNHFKLQLDGHKFTVIQNDFVPIVPYTTDELSINIGQRYHVIVEANQPVGNYYLRAINAPECGYIENDGLGMANGIVSYFGAGSKPPVVKSPPAVVNALCEDEPLAGLVPVVQQSVDPTGFAEQLKSLPVNLGSATVASGENVFVWYLNGITQDVNWTTPTLRTIASDRAIANANDPAKFFSPNNNIITLKNEGQWAFWVIQNQLYIPHPMHLHGHDFAILGQGDGFFDPEYNMDQLNFHNPNRRDVATLRNNGWTVMAFKVDNPGVWLLHCHILWHSTQGLNLQFVELPQKIPDAFGAKTASALFSNQCKDFQKYEKSPANVYGKTDVGGAGEPIGN